MQRRGVHYTQNALQTLDKNVHQLRGPAIFGSRDAALTPLPDSLLLRDGTTILTDPTPLENNPYLVDYRDGKLVLVDDGEVVEEVEFWRKPSFYDKQTSSGLPMNFVVTARPQRLNILPTGYCHFWNNDKGCLFCDIVNNLKQQKSELGIPTKLNPVDIAETVAAALQEKGRFTSICLTAGSNTRGREPFDEEVDYYIDILQEIGKKFSVEKFPSQLIGTAFTEKQLSRLYENTGLMSYTADIEVLNEQVFNAVCPGKAEWIGYQEWKRRLIKAVNIFGWGNVNTGIVAGVELVPSYGFKNENDALSAYFQEAEELASHGVTTVYVVWVPRPHSVLKDERNASLEYYVRLAQGLHDIRKKYKLRVDFDDYRRCGNHPDSDLARLL